MKLKGKRLSLVESSLTHNLKQAQHGSREGDVTNISSVSGLSKCLGTSPRHGIFSKMQLCISSNEISSQKLETRINLTSSFDMISN